MSPLIMHNGAGASPTDSRKMPEFLQKKYGGETFREVTKTLTKKRDKSDEDHEKLAELGFYSSLYLNNLGKIIYPAMCFEKAILDQARESKRGKLVQRGVVVDQDAPLDFRNKDLPLKELYEKHRYDTLVKVSMSKTPRTRAIFPDWTAQFTISFLPKIIDSGTIKDILALGEFYGSLERRPRFGRYKIAEFSVQK